MTSVPDIPHEVYVNSAPAAIQPIHRPLAHHHCSSPEPNLAQSVMASSSHYNEYFKSLGDTTGPDLNTEIMNKSDPGDAMQAVRKNSEVLGGSYMVGVKWADPALADVLLGQLSLVRSTNVLPDVSIQPPAGLDVNMAVDSNAAQQPHYGTNTPPVDTPIRLAPSAAAFRRAMGSADKVPPPNRPGLTSCRIGFLVELAVEWDYTICGNIPRRLTLRRLEGKQTLFKVEAC
ncbi:hypothetical protein F5887DRAFT_1203484 [Amanita rubescens]|nr:hypothetical protein F5887DRAFT_1203484 [Amanita rubescens]